jgi:hypothetical protein
VISKNPPVDDSSLIPNSIISTTKQTQLIYLTPHFTPQLSSFYNFSPISSTIPNSLEITGVLEKNEEFKFYTACSRVEDLSPPHLLINSSSINILPASLFKNKSNKLISPTNKRTSYPPFPIFPIPNIKSNISSKASLSLPTVTTLTQTQPIPPVSSVLPKAISFASSPFPRIFPRSEKICRSRECIEFLKATSRREYCCKKCQNREQNSFFFFFFSLFCYKLRRVECEETQKK